MRIHHLNCISSCPLCGALFHGHPDAWFRRGHLTCHCLLVETADRLVLCDTGFGLRDVADPASRLSGFFLFMLRPEFREELTAARQIARLGFRPDDVTDIVMSHLDFDHAGGLDDFPRATVHMLETEYRTATAQRSWLDRQRFRPQQWGSRERWRRYVSGEGDTWRGFSGIRPVDGLEGAISLLPLPGHTLGHAGILVRSDDGWLLHAADAYFDRRELQATPQCAPGLRFYQWMMEQDGAARLGNQRRLRDLAGHAAGPGDAAPDDAVRICCSHDINEFEALAKRPAGLPAEYFRSAAAG